MRRLLPLLATVLLALAPTLAASPSAAAPPAAGRVFDPAPYNGFQPGKTSKADVLRALGEPDARVPAPANHSTLMYDYNLPATAGTPARYLVIVVLFDPDDRFVRYRVYAKDSDAAGD